MKDLELKLPSANYKDLAPLVVSLTRKFWRAHDDAMTFEDALSESLLAVIMAERRFSSAKAKFITFAYRRIIGTTQDTRKKRDRYASRFTSYDIHKMPETVCNSFESEIANFLLMQKVERVMQTVLDPLMALVIHRHYYLDMPMSSIAQEFEVPVHRVQKIRASAIKLIRSQFSSHPPESWVSQECPLAKRPAVVDSDDKWSSSRSA